ncbi:MAG TPA: hypothetical protein VL096_12435 [Pirellulaceae bacterium]|nr:hypothetical protein [Pirellulaceae bacterium]
MSSVSPLVAHGLEFAKTLRSHWKLCVVPVVICSLAALGYALVKPDIWQATQVLHVRNEAAGKDARPGQFESIDAMKTAQETLLELTRNQKALADALLEAGPPADRRGTAPWPSADDIDGLRDSISVKAPGGAEFGRTEVINLSVQANSRDRAQALTIAVCDQLERNLQKLRNTRTSSVIDELTKSQQLAQIDLQTATRKLEDLEGEVGADLSELRLLNQSGTGESNLRNTLNQIKNELRAAKASFQDKQEQLKHLETSLTDAHDIVAMPNRLLESQPALKQLKDGLIAAQLRTAELAGTMSKDHPKVQAALASEAEVLGDLKAELQVAVRGLQADIAISKTLISTLERQRLESEQRLDRLAGLRAKYSNLDADVKQRSEIVQKANKDLAEARASQAAAKAASLITRIDGPQLSSHPIGPGRTMICAAGMFGGIATGMGLVFLVSPFGQATGRRWSDAALHLGRRATDLIPGAGRRKSDLAGGRRNGDPPLATPATSESAPLGRRGSDPVPVAPVVPAIDGRRTGQDRRQGPRRPT